MCMLAHEIEKWGRERELYALATTDMSELPIRPIPLLRQPSAPMVCHIMSQFRKTSSGL